MTDTPYTYDELDEIFRGDGHNDVIGLSAIDGLIAALVAGPAAVPPDEWLPLIFADHMPSTVEGSPESRATATILARYAEVDQILALHPLAYQPILMHHLGQFIVRPWALGFMMGLAKRRDDWLPILLGPKRQDMRSILACSELGRPMLPDLADQEVERIAAITEAPQIAAAVLAVNSFHAARRKPRKLDTLRRPGRRRV
jgi:yecA family protein